MVVTWQTTIGGRRFGYVMELSQDGSRARVQASNAWFWLDCDQLTPSDVPAREVIAADQRAIYGPALLG